MKLFLFGDCHFGESKFDTVNVVQWQFMEWVENVVENYTIDGIIFLGDRFVKRNPEGWIRDSVEKMFVDMAKLVKQVVIVCGNHDYYTKFDKTSSFDLLSFLVDNVEVVKDVEVVNVEGIDIGVLPWEDGEKLKESLHLLPKQVELVVGHVEMSFLQWSRGRGLSFDDFSCLPSLKLVVSGHIHSFTRKPMANGGDFLYLGVPFERSLGDDSSVGGLIVEFDSNGTLLRWEKVSGYGPRIVRFSGGSLEEYRGKVVVVEGSRYKDVTGVVFTLEEVAKEVLVVIGTEERYTYDGTLLNFEFGEDHEVYSKIQLLKKSFDSINYEKILIDWAKKEGLSEEEIEWGINVLKEVE